MAAFTPEQTSAYIQERLRIAGAGTQPIFSEKAVETVHLYSMGIPRVINLLCEHSLVNAYAVQERPIHPETVEAVAREFEFDQVSPIAPEGEYVDPGVYNSEEFLQNLGEALSRFRLRPPSPFRGRK
jgi:hypothetical protein